MTFVLLTIASIVIGLVVNEMYAWLPSLAQRLIKRASRRLPTEHRKRYEEEWLAELDSLPTSGITSIVFAVSTLSGARRTARALTESYRTPALKRALDVATSAIGLLVLAPLLGWIALGIRVGGKGPVMFRQQRRGADGHPFYMLKFRTMTAEPRPLDLAALPAAPAIRLRNDPRIGPFGRFLRWTSLDELPQFVNVVLGDMAIAGPRPRLMNEPPLEGAIGRAKPGLASWTSIATFYGLSVDEAERRDLELVEDWTLRRELRLLLATARSTLRRR